MIINLWSTPRTGSVWYSNFLANQYSGSLLVTEMFNRYHMNMYYVQDHNGTIRNYHSPMPNGFYKEYYINDQGELSKRKVMGTRTRTIDQEEEYCFELVKQVSATQQLILHNHIDPINPTIRDWLINRSHKNIWIYRKNKRLQLASYAIALSTKKFVAFNQAAISDEIVADCDLVPLRNLIRRIQVWDSFPKTDTIAFENIDFFNSPGYPMDQNINPWARISNTMQQNIDKLVTDYENNSN